MGDIGQQAGVLGGSLYHQIKSKTGSGFAGCGCCNFGVGILCPRILFIGHAKRYQHRRVAALWAAGCPKE